MREGHNDIYTGETIAASFPRSQVELGAGPGQARADPVMVAKLTKVRKNI